MSEQVGTAPKEKFGGGVMPDTAAGWLSLAGLVVLAVGALGTLMVWTAMGDPGYGEPDYSDVEKWLAVLVGMTVVALGLVVAGIGSVIARLERQELRR